MEQHLDMQPQLSGAIDGVRHLDAALACQAGAPLHSVAYQQGYAPQPDGYNTLQPQTSRESAPQPRYRPDQTQQTYYPQQPQQHPQDYAHSQQQQQQQYFSPLRQSDQRQVYTSDPPHPQVMGAPSHAPTGVASHAQSLRHASVPQHLQPRPFQQQREPPQRYAEPPQQQTCTQPQPSLQPTTGDHQGHGPRQQQPHRLQHSQAAAAPNMGAMDAAAPHISGVVGTMHGGQAAGHGGPSTALAPAYPAQAHYQRGSSGGSGGSGGMGGAAVAPSAIAVGAAQAPATSLGASQDASRYPLPAQALQQQQQRHREDMHGARYSPPPQQAPQQQSEPQQAVGYIPLQPRQPPQSLSVQQQQQPQEPKQSQQPPPLFPQGDAAAQPPLASRSSGGPAAFPAQGAPAAQAPRLPASQADNAPPLPAHLKPAPVTTSSAAPPAAAAPPGFVQLVEQPGGIQVDQQGGLRLVLTASGQAETRRTHMPEAVHALNPLKNAAAPAAAAPPQALPQPVHAPTHPGSVPTVVTFEPLRPPAVRQDWPQMQPHTGSAARAGQAAPPTADMPPQYVPAKRSRPQSEAGASGSGDAAEKRPPRHAVAEVSSHNGVPPANAGPSPAVPAAVPLAHAASGGGSEPPAARPDAARAQPGGRSTRVPIPAPQPRQPSEKKDAGVADRDRTVPPKAAEKGERPTPLEVAVERAENLESTVEAARKDKDMFQGMLPVLQQTCEQRMSDLSRSISAAKAEAKEAKEAAAEATKKAAAAAAKDAAAAKEAAAAAAAARAPVDVGAAPLAFIVDRIIRKLFPLETPEHRMLRVVAETLLLQQEDGHTASVHNEEVTLRAHEMVGATLCNKPHITEAVAEARRAGAPSLAQLLREHDVFEVKERVHKDHPTSRQWLARLRTDRLPSYRSLQGTFRAVIDALLPPEGAGGAAAAGGGSGAARAMARPSDPQHESADEREVLRCVALHLLEVKDAQRGVYNDTLGSAAAAAVPARLERKYGRTSGLDTLRSLLRVHPCFVVSTKFHVAKQGRPGERDETVVLNTALMLEYAYRARRQQEQQALASKKRKAGEAPADAEEGPELSAWWREERGRRLKKQRQS